MIINSQFFITSYTGKNALSLMQMPGSFNGDPVKTADYKKFIQSIDTIYGTQNIDGEIPKFWTRRVQTTNQLGNVLYEYQPHPESTLTELSSLASYYFILRDSTDAPVKIPVNGGEVIGYTDISSLPYVSGVRSCSAQASSDSKCVQLTLTENNKCDMVFELANLRPTDSYIYTIDGVGGNWPVTVTPISGIIKPARPSGIIDVNLLFCPSTGLCGGNILDYSLIDECYLKDQSKIYTTLKLSLKPELQPDMESFSDHYTVICDKCLPPKPTIEFINVPSANPGDVIDANFDGVPYHAFRLKVTHEDNKTKTDRNYVYTVETLSAEWPVIYITPTGGIVTIKNGQTSVEFDGRFYFCPTTGLCPPGSNNVPPYTIPSYPIFLKGEDDLADVSKVKIRASVDSYDCPGQKVYSNTSTISYFR